MHAVRSSSQPAFCFSHKYALTCFTGLADSLVYCIENYDRLYYQDFTSKSCRELRELESCLLSNLARCLAELKDIEARIGDQTQRERVEALKWELDARKRKRRQRLGLPTESILAKLFE